MAGKQVAVCLAVIMFFISFLFCFVWFCLVVLSADCLPELELCWSSFVFSLLLSFFVYFALCFSFGALVVFAGVCPALLCLYFTYV